MKSRGPKRIILTMLLIGATTGLGWLIHGQLRERAGAHGGAKTVRPVPVEVAPIRTGTIALKRTFSGELEALAEFLVAPKVSGRVERMMSKPELGNEGKERLTSDTVATETDLPLGKGRNLSPPAKCAVMEKPLDKIAQFGSSIKIRFVAAATERSFLFGYLLTVWIDPILYERR